MQTTPTIRVLTTTAPDVDWVQYAKSIGAAIVTGNEARADCAAERDAALHPVSDDPGHTYWKYLHGKCRCEVCAADWRRASARYRATGSYKAAVR